MKQGKHIKNLILWIFLAAVLAYFGYAVVSSLYDPLTTATVMEYEAGAGVSATGYVVREETVIDSGYDITILSASEGQRVKAGGNVATGYLSAGAQERQSRITELRSQLSQLDYARQDTATVTDQATLDTQIANSLVSLRKYLTRRDMNSVNAISPELKGLVLRRATSTEDQAALRAQAAALQSELDSLTAQSATDVKPITVEHSGYFSETVDGWETVLTPAMLDSLTMQKYEQLAPAAVSDRAIGKLIESNTWYYVTALTSSQVPKELSRGDTVKLTFARDFYDEIEMTVSRVSDSEAGYKVLVLSCSRYMQDLTLLRNPSADLVFQSYAGLRVPKEAVRVDEEGRAGVYVLEGAVAKWKNITILHDNGESYVVVLDKSSTANLWPGDEVIIHAKDLADGKVVG